VIEGIGGKSYYNSFWDLGFLFFGIRGFYSFGIRGFYSFGIYRLDVYGLPKARCRPPLPLSNTAGGLLPNQQSETTYS
jgi:hypothetical protein